MRITGGASKSDIGFGATAIIALSATGVGVTGTVSSTGDLTVGSSKFVVTATSGDLAQTGDTSLSKTAAAITHTAAAGATSGLTISSDNGFVEVESVRITGGASKSDIGFGATAIIALSATGVGVTGTVSSTGDLTVGSSKFVVTATSGDLAQTGDTSLSKTAAAITHTAAAGATSGLTISSDNGFVVITGGTSTASYVDVEDVRFTSKDIGISGTATLISLASTGVSVTGTVSSTGNLIVGSSKFVVTATSGDLAQTGVTTLSKTASAITHTAAAGATSGLTISSDNGFVVITGGTSTASYVDVEDVRFTSKDIGISGTATLISLASTGVSVTGTVSSTGNLIVGSSKFVVTATSGDLAQTGDTSLSKTAAAITHTAAAGATSGLTISSDNGFVEVESVRITGGASKSDIGFGSTAIIALSATGVGVTGTVSSTGDLTVGSSKFVVTATSGDLAQTGDTSLSKTAAAITHTAAAGATSGLTISSDNGFVIVKGTNSYVDVEDVRFTNKDIGISGTATLISLASTGVGVTGTVSSTGDLTVGSSKFVVTATSGRLGSSGGHVLVEDSRRNHTHSRGGRDERADDLERQRFCGHHGWDQHSFVRGRGGRAVHEQRHRHLRDRDLDIARVNGRERDRDGVVDG